MTYAQIKSGHKMHLVYEPGEGPDDNNIVRAGHLSTPLCGAKVERGYRMTCNVSLSYACKNCRRVFEARHGRK